MHTEPAEKNDMNLLQKIVGIFTEPTETFRNIDKKPTWIVPFIILMVAVLISQFLVLDISLADRIAVMEAGDMAPEQLEAARTQMEGPFKYIGFVFIPVGLLVVWLITAAVFLFTGNVIMGGQAKLKNLFAMVAWSSLIGVVQTALVTFLVLSRGTSHGVTISPAALLPLHAAGDKPSLLYQLLSKFDIFTIWQLVLWILGVAVIYRFTVKKSSVMVVSIWAVYTVISIVLGQLLGGMFGM